MVREIFKKPVKRSELSRIFGCSDRMARKEISKLQEQYNIINLQDGKGYFLADDETALRYAKQERKRAISAFKKANKIMLRCSQNGEGISIPVRAHLRTINKVYINKNQISMEDMENEEV